MFLACVCKKPFYWKIFFKSEPVLAPLSARKNTHCRAGVVRHECAHLPIIPVIFEVCVQA
jgi:hypothetical protein